MQYYYVISTLHLEEATTSTVGTTSHLRASVHFPVTNNSPGSCCLLYAAPVGGVQNDDKKVEVVKIASEAFEGPKAINSNAFHVATIF